MKKKLLAMLLTFSMLAGLMPETAVHAAEGPQDGQVEYVGGYYKYRPGCNLWN